MPNNNFKTPSGDNKRGKLESSNEVYIYCQNNERLTLTRRKAAKDGQRNEIVTANFFQEKRGRFEDVLITELFKYFLQLGQQSSRRVHNYFEGS